MIDNVKNNESNINDSIKVNSSNIKIRVKIIYYNIILKFYKYTGRLLNIGFTNSTWTKNHV